MKQVKTIKEAVELAVNHKGENEYYSCKFKLREENKTFKTHEVSICNRDLLFFTDKGTLNYCIDTIGYKDYLVLVNIDLEE